MPVVVCVVDVGFVGVDVKVVVFVGVDTKVVAAVVLDVAEFVGVQFKWIQDPLYFSQYVLLL